MTNTPPAPTKAELVDAVRANLAAQMDTECRQLALMALMCDTWSVTDSSALDSRAEGGLPPSILFGERLLDAGADGTPQVAEFLSLELGPALQVSPESAWRLIGDVLNLRHRLPILWEHTLHGRVRAWAARQIAQTTAVLPATVARRLDSLLAVLVPGATPVALVREAERLTTLLDGDADERRERARRARHVDIRPSQRGDGIALIEGSLDAAAAAHLDRTLDSAARTLKAGGQGGTHDNLRSDALGLLAHPARAHLVLDHGLPLDHDAAAENSTDPCSVAAPATAAADTCRHGAELVLRVRGSEIAQGLGGTLDGFGPVTRAHLNEILAGCASITVKPVIDLREPATTNVYKPPPSLVWRVAERDQREQFPFSNRASRSRLIDLDHTIPHADGGKTSDDNLGCLSRKAHRARTHAGFRVEQVRPGVFRWQTPTRQQWWTDAHGTYAADPDSQPRHTMNDPDATTGAILGVALELIAQRDRTRARPPSDPTGDPPALDTDEPPPF